MLARIQPASSESAQAPGSSSSGAGPSAKFPDFLMQAQNNCSAPQSQSTPQARSAPGKNIFNGPNPPKPAAKKVQEDQPLTSIPALVGVPVDPQLLALLQAASQALVSGPDQAPLAGAAFPTTLGPPTVPQFSPAAPKEAPIDSAAGKQPAVALPDAWPLAGSSVRDTSQNELVAKGLSESGTILSGTPKSGHGKGVTESFSETQPGMITTKQKSTDVPAAELTTQNRASTSSETQSAGSPDAGKKNIQADPISFPDAMALAGSVSPVSGKGSDQAELTAKLQTSNLTEDVQASGQPAQGAPVTAATPDPSASAIPANAAVVVQNTSPVSQSPNTATIQPRAQGVESVQRPTQTKASASDQTAFAGKVRASAAQILQQSTQSNTAVDLKNAIHKSSPFTDGSKSVGANSASGASTTIADANPQGKPQPEHKAAPGSPPTQPAAQDASQAAASQPARVVAPNSSTGSSDAHAIPQPNPVLAPPDNSRVTEAPAKSAPQLPDANAALAASPVQVQAARIFQSGSQVEMRMGLHTETFGAVQVHATVSDKQVDVALGSERGDLRASVASELPMLQSSLQQHDLRLDQVRTLAQVPAGQSDSFFGSGGQQHAFRRPEHPGTTAYEPVLPKEDEAMVESRTGLSIRV